MDRLPLSIRDVAPGPGAERITGTRPDGVPDGVHTGGVFRYQDEIWKPLDGRPFMNADYHFPTREAELLELMAGEVCFPRNWRVTERNGRQWLVRKPAYLPKLSELTERDMWYAERAVRLVNENHWEIGDGITLAYDADTLFPFILDLSCANPTGGHCVWQDEYWRVIKFFKDAGWGTLAETRERASSVLKDPLHFKALTGQDSRDFHFVYASFYRPVSRVWAVNLPQDAVLIDSLRWYGQIIGVFHAKGIPHTWIVTREPLSRDVQHSYELQLCWWTPVKAALL